MYLSEKPWYRQKIEPLLFSIECGRVQGRECVIKIKKEPTKNRIESRDNSVAVPKCGGVNDNTTLTRQESTAIKAQPVTR